jgi:hypothetical protein
MEELVIEEDWNNPAGAPPASLACSLLPFEAFFINF